MRHPSAGALLIVGLLAPALPSAAAPVFLDTYGGIHSARSFLVQPDDARPRDAWQSWGAKDDEAPSYRLLAGAFYRDDDGSSLTGGGAALAGRMGRVGWSGDFFYGRLKADGVPGTFDTLGVTGRLLLWEPVDAAGPVVSLVGSYFDPEDLGRRWDIQLAADQRLSDSVLGTVNIGFGQGNFGNAGTESDLILGLGAMWAIRPGLSVSADYVFDNDVRGEDAWSLSAAWALPSGSSLRLGTGTRETFFASYIHRWDR